MRSEDYGDDAGCVERIEEAGVWGAGRRRRSVAPKFELGDQCLAGSAGAAAGVVAGAAAGAAGAKSPFV